MPPKSASEGQQMPVQIPDEERELIVKAFGGNDELLKSIRALFFGLPVTANEKAVIKATFSDPKLMQIMWQRFVPSLQKDAAIGTVQDVWMGAEQMIFGAAPTTIKQAIEYKRKAIDMVREALLLLADPDGLPMTTKYDPLKVIDELGIELLARNQYIRHIEQQLLFLKIISQEKVETPKEKKERVAADSTK